MDIHSLSARTADTLVLFGAENLPGGMPAKATGAISRKNVVQKNPKEKKQASSQANAAEIAKALDPPISAFRNTALSFSIHEGLGKTVIRIIDQDTKEVIRQIPPEETLRLIARMAKSVGMLMDKEA
jgi:flagellar protein FlaG